MATIPDFTAVGASNPSGRTAIARPSGRNPVASALQDVGEVVGKIAERKYKREADLAYATAKSEYVRRSIEIESEVEASPDYNTWQQQYQAGIGKARAEISGKLRDEGLRQNFEIETGDDEARMVAKFAERARGRKRETQRAGVDQLTDDNRTAILSTADETSRVQLMTSTNEAIDAAVAQGIITPEEAVVRKRTFVENYAKGRAETLDPASRYKALSAGLSRDENGQAKFAKTGTWVDFIRPDERLKMIEGAEIDQRQQEELARRKTEEATRETKRNFLEQFESRKLTTKQVLDSDLTAEDQEHFINLIKKQAKPDSSEIQTDWGTYYMLMGKASDPNSRQEFAGADLLKYRGKLGDTEFKQLIGVQSAILGKDDPKADNLTTDEATQRRIVDDAMLSIGLDTTPDPKSGQDVERVVTFRRKVREQVAARQAQTGKKATDEEVQGIVDGLLLKAKPNTTWFWGDNSKRVFETKDDEPIVVNIADIPKAERANIEAALKRKGLKVTEEAIKALYENKLTQFRAAR